MPRPLRTLSLALLPLLSVSCTDRPADSPLAPEAAPSAALVADAAGIRVMTQNLYLGANLDLLLTADDPSDVAEVFAQLETTTLAGNFGRVAAIARQIADHDPHLVGLQEVTTYTLDFGLPQPVVLDFLAILQMHLDALYLAGEIPFRYVDFRNELTQVPFTASLFGPFPDVTYADADAILVREDVEVLDAPDPVVFAARETFTVAGTSFENVRGYMGVDVRVDGHALHFGNTHLEVQRFQSTQLAQTAEMLALLEIQPLPVLLVGDFNSAANHDAPEDQKTASYRTLRQAGFQDLWLREPHSVGGATCCHAATLTSPMSQLTQRLDLVLARYGRAGFGGRSDLWVVGEEPGDRIEVLPGLSLWPADHAGVAATLWPAPGLSGRSADMGRSSP